MKVSASFLAVVTSHLRPEVDATVSPVFFGLRDCPLVLTRSVPVFGVNQDAKRSVFQADDGQDGCAGLCIYFDPATVTTRFTQGKGVAKELSRHCLTGFLLLLMIGIFAAPNENFAPTGNRSLDEMVDSITIRPSILAIQPRFDTKSCNSRVGGGDLATVPSGHCDFTTIAAYPFVINCLQAMSPKPLPKLMPAPVGTVGRSGTRRDIIGLHHDISHQGKAR
jgi:hypothetical protein